MKMKYRKGKGFLDKIGDLSFNQQGPSWGMGFAPPYGGMLGENGKGRRMYTASGIRRRRGRRGRGIVDHIKSAWNYIKGNKDIQKYGKEGLSYLGGHAKELIKAKVDSIKRKLNNENKYQPPTVIPKGPIGMPAKEVTIQTKPAIGPTLRRTRSLDDNRAMRALAKTARGRGMGIKRKIMMKKMRGGKIKPHFKARGIPPLPPGLRA